MTIFNRKPYNCKVVNSEMQILDEMNEIIKNAKKKNKI